MAVLRDPLVFRGDVGLGPLGDGQTLGCHHFLLPSTGFLGIHMRLIHALLVVNLEAEDLLEHDLHPFGQEGLAFLRRETTYSVSCPLSASSESSSSSSPTAMQGLAWVLIFSAFGLCTMRERVESVLVMTGHFDTMRAII